MADYLSYEAITTELRPSESLVREWHPFSSLQHTKATCPILFLQAEPRSTIVGWASASTHMRPGQPSRSRMFLIIPGLGFVQPGDGSASRELPSSTVYAPPTREIALTLEQERKEGGCLSVGQLCVKRSKLFRSKPAVKPMQVGRLRGQERGRRLRGALGISLKSLPSRRQMNKGPPT